MAKIKVLPPDWLMWAAAIGGTISAIFAAWALHKQMFHFRGKMDIELSKLKFALDRTNRVINVEISGVLLRTKGDEPIYIWGVALNPPTLGHWYIKRYLQFSKNIPFEMEIDNNWGQQNPNNPWDLLDDGPLPIRLTTKLVPKPLVKLDSEWFNAAHWLSEKAFRISVDHRRGMKARTILEWTTA